jgi:IS30 family transposase
MNTLPELFKNSITWDQGSEMHRHAQFSMATDMPVYFCDPHSPWQRGSNENTHGLLRQYFPKGTDLSGYTQQELDAVADELNDRPRQTLDFPKPTDVFNQLLLDSTTGALTN